MINQTIITESNILNITDFNMEKLVKNIGRIKEVREPSKEYFTI